MSNSNPDFSGDDVTLTQTRKDQLAKEGYLHIPEALGADTMAAIRAAVARLEAQYPYGFINKGVYASQRPEPRPEAPKPSDYAPTIIYPNVGFMEPDIFLPLANPALHALIESVVGEDYYLSNTWLQSVPPGTGRMAFHKDPRGSVSFVIMLDEIGDDMGSTCLVPGSHLNTPPASFCMNDIQKPHPEEIDLSGKPGDIVIFTPETWHARASNHGKTYTRRLFFNFYSRASKATTSWAKGVSEEEVLRAQRVLPEQYRKMFRIDAALTSTLQTSELSESELATGAESHDEFFADIRHSRRVYGKSVGQRSHAGYILPYTTRLMEHRRFSLRQYLGHVKPVPTLKIAARAVLGKRIDGLRKLLGR